MLDVILGPGGPHRTIFGPADELIGDLSRKAGRIRCEEHRRIVEVEVLSRDGDNAEVRVRGCCVEVIERAGRMLL